MASYRDLIHAIIHKVPGEGRQGKETQRWAIIDGRKVLRVTYPKKHSRRSGVPAGTLSSIKRQLRLSHSDFKRFVDCPLTAAEYEHILRVQIADEARRAHEDETGHEAEGESGAWTCTGCSMVFQA